MKKKILLATLALTTLCGFEKENEETKGFLLTGKTPIVYSSDMQATIIPPRIAPPIRPTKMTEEKEQEFIAGVIPPIRPVRPQKMYEEKEQNFIVSIIPPIRPPRRISNYDQLV